MGEILSKETVDLLKKDEVKSAIRTFIEGDGGAPQPVVIKSAEGEPAIVVKWRIATT